MARKGLMGKYIRLASKAGAKGKTLFKKAWALQKRARGATKKSKPATSSKGANKVATKTKTKTVVKIKYRNKPKKSNPGKSRQRVQFFNMRNKAVNATVNTVVISGSTLASTALVNMTPRVKDLVSWQKALAQFGVGLVGFLFIPNVWAKKAMAGTMAGGGITWMLPWLKRQFPEAQFFGNNNNNQLTPYQISRLQMGRSARNMIPKNQTAGCAGPWDGMQGPWDGMNGPWNAVNGPVMARNQDFRTVANS